MSIEIDNPKTLLGKVDAAHNLVAQIRIALAVGDISHAKVSQEKADKLLFEALQEMGEMGIK